MTYDDIVRMALEKADVAEALQYGGPCLKRNGRFMLGLKADGETISAKLDWENRERLLQEYPEIIYITPHFATYPGFLIRLPLLPEDLGRELIDLAWEDAPKPAKYRK